MNIPTALVILRSEATKNLKSHAEERSDDLRPEGVRISRRGAVIPGVAMRFFAPFGRSE